MSNFNYTAADELDRRATNRGLKRTLTGAEYLRARVAEPVSAEGLRLAKLSTDALVAEAADTPAPTPKPARKTTRKTAAKAPAKAARKAPAKAADEDLVMAFDGVMRTPAQARQAAWQWRNAEYHAGRKHTVAAAYALFGTVHAGKK